MATAVFQGASSDWDDTDNWTGGSGAGGVPANNDTAVINQSSQDLDTNLTTGLTGITLYVGPNYTGTIGGSANHLDIDGGTFEFASGGNGCFVTGVWTTVVVKDGIASSDMLQFKANASTDIGTLRCVGGEGTVTVGANSVLDDLVVTEGAENLTGVVAASVTSFDNATIAAGVWTLNVSPGTLLTVRGSGRVTVEGSDATTLTLEGDGVVTYNSSGGLTLTGWGGYLDGTQNTNATVSLSGTIYEGFTADFRNGLQTWAGNSLVTNGGLIYPPVGATLTFA